MHHRFGMKLAISAFVLAAATAAASCSTQDHGSQSPALAAGTTSGGACYSVTSFDVGTRPDGHTEGHIPVAIDERDRVLVNVSAAFDSGYYAIDPSAFLWDGRRVDLPRPTEHRVFYAEDMNERGEIVGVARSTREDAQAFAYMWRGLKPIALGVQLVPYTALRINELGHVAGTFTGTDGAVHAFLWRDGAVTDLGRGAALDLNDSDDVVGWDATFRAVVWRADGSKREVGVQSVVSGATWDTPYGTPLFINGRGDIAGSYRQSLSPERRAAFVSRGGVVRELSFPGSGSGDIVALNERGDAIGSFALTPVRHAFLFRGGTLRDLGTLGGENSSAFAINENGVIAGFAHSLVGVSEPVLWDDGGAKVLPVGAYRDEFVAATHINDRGTVAGIAEGEHGYGARAMLWTPSGCNGTPDAGPPEPPPPEEPTE